MVERERIATIALLLGAAGLAILWPLSAHAINPLALPSLLALVLVSSLVLRRPEYGVAIVLALTPLINSAFSVGSENSSFLVSEPFRVVVPALAVGVLAYSLLVMRIRTPSGIHMRFLSGAVALFATSALVSSAQALEPSVSLPKVFLIITAAIVFSSVRLTCDAPHKLLVVVGGALAGLLIASIQGIADQVLGVFSTQGFVSGAEVVGRVQGSFGHPNLFGGFLAFLIPVGLSVTFSSSFSSSLRWLGLTATAVAVPALIFSYSRGAMFGLFIGGAIWLALLRPRMALLLGVVVVASVVALAPGALKSRFENDSSGDVALRSDIWNGAIEIYSSHPVLGVGISNFPTAYDRLPANSATASQRRLLHDEQLLVPPHAQNIYLQAMAEQGIVGLLALLGVLIGGLVTTFQASRSSDPTTRALGFGIGVGLVGVMVDGMLEIVVYSETILPLFALLAVAATLVDTERAAAVGTAPAADPQLSSAAA